MHILLKNKSFLFATFSSPFLYNFFEFFFFKNVTQTEVFKMGPAELICDKIL